MIFNEILRSDGDRSPQPVHSIRHYLPTCICKRHLNWLGYVAMWLPEKYFRKSTYSRKWNLLWLHFPIITKFWVSEKKFCHVEPIIFVSTSTSKMRKKERQIGEKGWMLIKSNAINHKHKSSKEFTFPGAIR